MTAIQIASSVIEKLQEQNRISLEALQKTQSDMRRLEKQLTEKEQLLKIMENKVRTGSNTYLEMSNRQKEITIKHLELQIQKLLKSNEDLELQVRLSKSDICEKCESKYFMGAAVDNKPASKSSVRRGIGRSVPSRQVSQMETQKREKMLERIIEHKDKRIFSLTKDVQRLTHVEKELSNKVFRLTKLLPMSHMSTEVLTECLLKEIQSLELQIQHYQEKYDILGKDSGQSKSSKSYSSLFDSKSRTPLEKMDTNEKTYSSSSRKVNRNFIGSSSQKNVNVSGENIQQDNGSMVSKLHLLYNDVLELKQLFATENEKLFMNLSKESLRNDMLKTQWEEVIGRLSEIAEMIESILQVNSQSVPNKSDSNNKENIILRLQDRLKEALELTTQYENENSELKSTIGKLKDQIKRDQLNSQYTQTDVRQSPSKTSPRKAVSCHSVDTQHLRELLNEKQKQLDSVESHLRTYQNWVGQLQGVSKESLHSSLQQSSSTVNKNTSNQAMNIQSNNDVRKSTSQVLSSRNIVGKDVSNENKLEVAERNIKTLEDAIEGLQRVIQSLSEKNRRLESEISASKEQLMLSNTNIEHNASLKAKLQESEEELVKIQSSNKDLENNVHSLQEENLSLQGSLQEVNSKLEQQQHEAKGEQTVLQSKLDIAEKRVSTLENNLAHAQNSIEELKEDNVVLKSTLQTSESMKSLEAEAQKDEVMKLKNDLILKERDIQNLKESLHEIESKALEVSYHRKKLRQEIEKLCDVLLENSDVNIRSDPNKSIENRKAIYKMAVLQSAKALLQLDEDYNVQSRTNTNGGALNEMSQQLTVYLTEVARINELLSIKNKQREDLLKEYLDGSVQLSQLEGLSRGGPSGVVSLPASSTESSSESSSEAGTQSSYRNKQTAARNTESSGGLAANRYSKTSAHSSHRNKQTDAVNDGSQTALDPQTEQDAVTSHLLSRCSKLDDLLEKQQQEHLLSKKEVERLRESIADLQGQLYSKNKLSKLLNTLIEMLRSKGCSSEIAMEQLKSDIKWLVAENQKLFEKSVMTQNELCKRKEENEIMKKDLENLRREHVNEMYDYAKTDNELKNLREQALNNAASMLNDEVVVD